MDATFGPQTLADDLGEVRRIYARFFAALDEAHCDRPVKGGSNEWTLHETLAGITCTWSSIRRLWTLIPANCMPSGAERT